MSSTRLFRSVLALRVEPIFVLLFLGCSAEAPDRNTHVDGAGDQGAETPDEGDDDDDDAVVDAGVRKQPDSGGKAEDSGKGRDERGNASGDAGGAKGGSPDAGAKGGSPDAGGEADAGKVEGPGTEGAAGCEVAPITAAMRDSYENMNNAYYTKYASANGVILATGPKVDDAAVIQYCRLLTEMHANEDVRKAVIADKMWFTMIDENEQLSSLPQISKAYGTSLNQRARGLGGLTPTICAEDSIMCLPGDRWRGDCICPHEAGHTLYSSGIARVPSLSSRLKTITASARSSGRIANAYVWEDGNESGMMAWGVQVWYDCAINGTKGAYHSDINTRAELQKEMPEFYEFLSDLMPADRHYDDCYSTP